MSDLTLEKMDKINFLITEVSLECMGNSFFDIYGNQTSSLIPLISASSLKPRATNADEQSALWKTMNKDQTRPFIPKTFKAPAVPARKRRASFSNTNNEPDTSNDPESLLVPMAPKAAKIANRRQTVSVQLAKYQQKNGQSTANQKHQTPDASQKCFGSIREIKRNLKCDIDARKYKENKWFKIQTRVN